MAKTISDENIRLNIIINGNSAQKELLDLEKSTREYTRANKELSAAKAKLAAEGKKETQEYKNLSAEIKANNVVIGLNKTKMEALQKEIGITGLTMSQLGQKAKLLKMQLLNAVPGGEAYTRYKEELRQVTARMDELKGKAVTAKLSLSSLADGFNKYAALGASVIAMGTGMVLSLQKMIDYNGKLSDAMSDVRKTTGLTKEEVDELTKSFGMLLTRTSRIDLLKIAEEGGRIGIVKDEIAEFVEVMNMTAVALGDSFTGGVSEVAAVLGKLKFLFTETKDLGVDLAYKAIGSAINELGANGVATEQNIANFATRLGSLPNALKPSIADSLALGAAFEESGIEAEIAGRAYNIFLKQAATESDKFAKVMGITTEEVQAMINSNPTEFFLQFSDGLKGMNATETANTLQYLGVNAEGANKIVGAAGNNMGRFRELLKLSNDSMIEATSTTNEYGIKNSNLAATLEKVKKTMVGMFSSETLIKGLTTAVEWFAKFIGATEDAEGKTTFWRNGLIALIKTALILTTAIVSYKTALKLATFWTESATIGTASYNLIQKATTISTNFLTAAIALGKAAYYLLTGQLVLAKEAMVAFNLATKLSPVGLLVGLVAAAAVAYIAFSDSAKEAATKQSLLNDATKEANKQIGFERENLKLLLEIARDETRSKEARQLAVDELNKIVPEYNKNLTIESANTLDATDKLNKYIEAKEREIMADILLADWRKKVAAQQEAENASLEENIGWMEKSWNLIKSGGNVFAFSMANTKTAVANKQQLIALTKEETEAAKQLYDAQLRINDKAGANSPGGGGGDGPKEGDTMEENGVSFVYKNGAWQKVNKEGGGGGGGTGDTKDVLTPEDQAIADSKKKLAEFLADFENDQALQKELKKLEEAQKAEEEELIYIENKFLKMAEEAGFETIVAAGLEEAKQAEIDAVKTKWKDKEISDKKKKDDELEKLDKKNKDAQIKAENDLAQAKRDALTAGIGLLKSFFKEGTGMYKAMFALEKALAIADVIIKGIQERATIAATWGAVPAVSIPMMAASKIRTVIGVATIAATAIEGFEDGLYPITRAQDGKQFNASFGGQTSSGMVNKPTVFMAGENGPELIIDSAAYKQINPDIKYALHREIARVKGFETGLYRETSTQPTSVDGVSFPGNSNDALLTAALNRNSDILEKLDANGVIAYMSNDLKNAKEMKDAIADYEKLRDKNKR